MKIEKKWRKLKRSKWMYPTKIVKGSRSGRSKGHLDMGEKRAILNIEHQMGGKLRYVKTAHTRTQWVFMVPTGQSFKEA